MNDSQIIELYLKRNEAALSETSAKYGHKLTRLAYSILNDHGAAEECVNDVYLKAWNSIPPNEPRSWLLPYLLRITRQLAINRLTRSSAIKRSAVVTELSRDMEECIPFEHSMTDELEAKELISDINLFLSELSKDKRDVFMRRYWFFDTVSEISELTGFKESKVKTMLFRIRKDLKSFLEEKGYTI